jgi:hypothetical protein
MTVEESWEKIERRIAQHAPEEASLPAPCIRADLEALYESLGGGNCRTMSNAPCYVTTGQA